MSHSGSEDFTGPVLFVFVPFQMSHKTCVEKEHCPSLFSEGWTMGLQANHKVIFYTLRKRSGSSLNVFWKSFYFLKYLESSLDFQWDLGKQVSQVIALIA